MNRGVRWLLGGFGILASGAALAHTGGHAGSGFAAGLAHPFMGLDHLLAMVAVGAWAAQLGRRYLVLVPVAFVAAMAAGAAAALSGIALPQVEGMVAASVVALGLLVAFAATTQWQWPVSLIALFALFHGHAHGTDMPALASPWLYIGGFLAATALLHAAGVAVGLGLRVRPGVLRAGGAAVGLAGGWLLIAAVA